MRVPIWNDMRAIKTWENRNNQPSSFRVVILSFEAESTNGKWKNLQFQQETNNFVLQPDGLVLGFQPAFDNKKLAFCMVSDLCSNDYVQAFLEVLNWPEDTNEQLYKH